MYIGAMERTLSMEYSQDIDESWDIFIQKYDKNFSENKTVEDMQMFNTETRETTGTKPTTDPNVYGRLYLTGTEKDYGIKWLTELNNEKTVMQIRAVELENDKIAIIYETYDLKSKSDEGYSYIRNTAKIYYMIIDGNGNIISSPTQISNVNLTPEEILQYKNGKIYWTSTEEGNNTIKLNVLDVANPIAYTKGDINGDGKISVLDANYGLRKLSKGGLTAEEIERGDVTGDGKYTILDINKVLRYLSGKIKDL
jgi:hypothetical protein